MGLQEMVTNAVSAMRAEELKDMSVLSLGEIIAKLEAIQEKEKGRDEEPWVRFDFGSLVPTTLDSWRGVYAELAIGYEDVKDWPKLSVILAEFKSAVGKTFTGYKGGNFKMGRNTPVWVANYGDVGDTAIVEVENGGYEVTLITRKS
jgi:hypothetical protein